MSSSRHRVCPVRPAGIPPDAPAPDEEWEEIVRSGLLDNEPAAREALRGDAEIVNSEDGNASIVAQGMPEPRQPTKAEVPRHNLTHLPYRSWCPECVKGRAKADPHKDKNKANDGKTDSGALVKHLDSVPLLEQPLHFRLPGHFLNPEG